MSRLHVNIDHVATVRQARRERFPDPVEFALACERAGAHGITCHLRHDRRHIQDADVADLRQKITTVLNLECSLAPKMLDFAAGSRADAFCLVPESREEITTEGGLDVVAEAARLREAVPRLTEAGGLVSLFVDPDLRQLDAAREVQAPFVELHTGAYANSDPASRGAELERLRTATAHGLEIGLRVNAGHGLDEGNVAPVAAIEGVEELNIGFAIVAKALFDGVDAAVVGMLKHMG